MKKSSIILYGVTHDVTADDFDGVYKINKWLSYMPKVSLYLRRREKEREGIEFSKF